MRHALAGTCILVLLTDQFLLQHKVSRFEKPSDLTLYLIWVWEADSEQRISVQMV